MRCLPRLVLRELDEIKLWTYVSGAVKCRQRPHTKEVAVNVTELRVLFEG